MRFFRFFPPVAVLFLLIFAGFISCTSVRSGKDAAGSATPGDESMAPSADKSSADNPGQKKLDANKPVSDKPASDKAPAAGLPAPVMPEGVEPLAYEKIAEIPILDLPVAEVVDAVSRLGREEWYGVYVMNQKVGAMSSGWTIEENGGQRRVVQKQTFRMEMNVLGGKKKMELATTAVYDAAQGDLLEHLTVQKADHLERTVRLVRRPDGSHAATVEDRAAGQPPAPAREYIPSRPIGGLPESDLAFSLVLEKGPKSWNPAKSWRARKFMSTDVSVAHEAGRVVAQEQRTVDGKTRTFYIVETLSDNPRSRVMSVYDDRGTLVISRVGSIEMRLEEAGQAKTGLGGRIDTGFDAMIRVRIEQPRELGKLVLQLEGPFPAVDFFNVDRYRLETVDGKKRLTLVRDNRNKWEKTRPEKLPEQVRPFLKAEPNIESDDPEIVALAKKAAGKTYLPADQIQAVMDFVGDYVEDTMRADIDSARMVARMKKGDCTEHSILATALLRALGYPARQVGGVGFVNMCGGADDCLEGLGYHAWTQVWVGRWVDVDPTWKQTPADVTHVLMGSTTDMQWLESLGKLRVTVLEKELAK